MRPLKLFAKALGVLFAFSDEAEETLIVSSKNFYGDVGLRSSAYVSISFFHIVFFFYSLL